MSLVIKIILLLCGSPLLKPVPCLSHKKGHLSPRVGQRHGILAFPDVSSQWAPFSAGTVWCADETSQSKSAPCQSEEAAALGSFMCQMKVQSKQILFGHLCTKEANVTLGEFMSSHRSRSSYTPLTFLVYKKRKPY